MPTFDQKEEQILKQVIQSGNFTMGSEVRKFEDMFAKYFNSKHAVMVNSGSSANLLAVSALVAKDPNLTNGEPEIIVPAVGWATSYFPFSQYGFRLKFVDIDLNTLNYDLDLVQEAISKNTKAILAINVLGNPNQLDKLREMSDNYNLILFEDNCESMGAAYREKPAGTYGDVGTFSFFFSHHISTMEGGMILTDDSTLYEYLLSLRTHGWTRDLPADSILRSETKADSTEFQKMFEFILPGYNLRPLEMSGALGQIQLEKFSSFLEKRLSNAKYFQDCFEEFKDYIILQEEIGTSSWFGFSIILKPNLDISRDLLAKELIHRNIDSRPIITGNFTRQPVIKTLDHIIHGTLDNADTVHDRGLFIGNHPVDVKEGIDYVKECFKQIINK